MVIANGSVCWVKRYPFDSGGPLHGRIAPQIVVVTPGASLATEAGFLLTKEILRLWHLSSFRVPPRSATAFAFIEFRIAATTE